MELGAAVTLLVFDELSALSAELSHH